MNSIVYKLNNLNTISWWKILVIDESVQITWGRDIKTIDNPTDHLHIIKCEDHAEAVSVAESRTREQIKRKGYSYKIPKEKPNLPMLAQTWASHANRTPFPAVAIQPKLDGMRCIGRKERLTTRRNLGIGSVPHINLALQALPPEIKLDGELYIHNTDLQTIQSITRRSNPSNLSPQIEYHVFDQIDLELPFQERFVALQKLIGDCEAEYNKLREDIEFQSSLFPKQFPVRIVPTIFVGNHSHSEQVTHLLRQEFKKNVGMNYEGCIVRNAVGLYEPDYRSPDLLKYKESQSDEFEIVDVAEGSGKCGIFVCKTHQGAIFEATPSWTSSRKRVLLRNKEDYIGRWLTVEFEKYSNDGVPLKPIGKLTHDAKDKD